MLPNPSGYDSRPILGEVLALGKEQEAKMNSPVKSQPSSVALMVFGGPSPGGSEGQAPL